MAFDVQTLVSASNCADCLSPNQKLNAALYLLNSIFEGGGSGGIVLHNLLSATHPDTVPGPSTRGALVVGNATPDWESLPIGAANRVLRSDGVDAAWSQLVLTTDVTGIMPIANGGTNSSAALNNNRIMVSSGGAIVEAAALTNGQLLIGSTGAAPVASSLTAGANITITPGAASITIAATGVVTQAYSTIQEEGAALPQQSILNFISAALTASDDPGNSRTNVTLAHSALTRVDDTNVTLTLGGSPTMALLAATSLTLGWTGVLSPARGGTGTSTVFTQGSVIFAGAAGVFSEDNASFFWDDTNNRLGIGTIVPAGYLELSSNLFPSNNALIITLSNDTGTNFPNIFYRRSRGTVALPTAVLADDRLGGFGFRGYGATGYFTADNAVFRAFAAENFTNTAMGTYVTLETTPLGSTTRLERVRIDPLSLSMSPTGTAAGRTNELRFLELAASGTNYTGFRASDAMAASEIYVLPNAAPAANRFLQAAAVAGGVSALSWAQVSLTADVTGVLPVANGGSGTSTAFTAGSAIFAGAAGVYSQDNANFFWDDTNNRLGLGVAVPLSGLHVVSLVAGTVGLIVKAAAAQSANLTEWQSSAAVANTVINAAGNISIPTTTSTVGIIFQGATRLIHTFGTNNFFAGPTAGNFTLTGTANVGIGGTALAMLTSGSNNVGIGFNTLAINDTGANNVALGSSALISNISGSSNVAVGVSALRNNTTGDSNFGLGVNALFANTTGTLNVAVGGSSLATNVTGSNNVGIGASSLQFGTSDNNCGIGVSSLRFNTGSNSVAIGTGALGAVGSTGSNNIGIGFQAGNNLTTGSNNIIIGYDIDSPATTNSNILALGNLIFGSGVDGTGTTISSGGIGIGVITPTAKLHLRAGTTAANTAPLKFDSGSLNTTAVAGQHEYNGNHYLTNVGLLRFPVGGTLFDSFTDASVGGAEADIFSSTLLANTFNGNGDKVFAVYGGNFVTIGTESVQLKAKFAGNTIWDSTAIAISTGTTSWRVRVELIRVSSTVIRYTVSLNTTGASGFVYAVSGELTGLTLSGTNALALTGTSSGVGSGAGDIVGKMSCVEFKPAV